MDWLPGGSKEHHVRSGAESWADAHEVSALDGHFYIPDYEDKGDALRGRKDSARSTNQDTFSKSKSRGRSKEKGRSIARRVSRSKSSRSRGEADQPKSLLSRTLSRKSTARSEKAGHDSADLPHPRLTQLNCESLPGDEQMIGLAVGSPSQLQSWNPVWAGQPSAARMDSDLSNLSDQRFPDFTSKTKGHRWKKIGGLFKARHAFNPEEAPSPFYQLRMPYASQVADGSHASLQSPSDTTLAENDGRFLFDKILGPNGQLNHPHQHGNGGGRHLSEESPRPSRCTLAPRPWLDVEIPDVQMERYSVMFQNLFDKQEPSGLLSRREKALNKLIAVSNEDGPTPEVARLRLREPDMSETVSHNIRDSHVAPEAHVTYPRRATSPTPSKSPCFSLFPPLPQAQQKILGTISSTTQSPLRRSFTSPALLSQMQETFNLDEVQLPTASDLKTKDNTVVGQQHTVSNSSPKARPSNSSVLAPTSPRISVDEGVPLYIKSSVLIGNSQYQSEVMNDQEPRVTHLNPGHIAPDAQSGPVNSKSVETEKQKDNRTDTHEETLAALGCPRSTTLSRWDTSSSLNASKARIDQVMCGPPPSQLPEAAAGLSRRQAALKKQETNGIKITPRSAANGPPKGAELARDVLELSASAAFAPTKEQDPSAMSPDQGKPLVQSFPHSMNEARLQSTQQTVPIPLGQQPQNVVSFSARGAQTTKGFRTGPPLQPSQTGGRTPHRTKNIKAHLPTSEPNASCPQGHVANAPPPAGPIPHATDPLFPTDAPPNRNPQMVPQAFHKQASPQQRPNAGYAGTPPRENDQDTVLEHYFDDANAHKSSHPPKSPRKLRKRPSTKVKVLTYLKSQANTFRSLEAEPQSPVPISNCSANATANLKPVASSPIGSSLHRHSHSCSHSSTFAVFPSDIRDKAARRSQASSVTDSPINQARPRSISSPPRRSPRVELGSIFDDPAMVNRSETSFYSHTNFSTPILAKAFSGPQSRSDGLDVTSTEPEERPPVPRRSPSRSPARSILAPRAGGNESRLTASNATPPKQSASAGTVGSSMRRRVGTGPATPGLGEHQLKNGGKIVERQGVLVPRIVDPDPERGHRAERSINIVIESI